jgi:hypothetical protein
MKYMKLLFTTLLILIISCTSSIDKMDKQILSFDSLPSKVRDIYSKKVFSNNTDFKYAVISTDTTINFIHEHTGMDDGIFTLITRGVNHHFYINGQHFKLKANQGDPFILHNHHLYYSLELNLADYNYKTAKYISVDLADNLK